VEATPVTTALALEEVTFGYGTASILARLTLSVAEGEILVLLGPSGGGKSTLYVNHDLREAASLADRIAVLENGRVVQEGTLDELRARPVTEFVDALIADLVWTGPR
jgi:ABC-type proline/glycine betaine transport system ATPase subunit